MTAGPESRAWFNRALGVLPGGVDSPVRAFGAVGGEPLVIASAHGSTITDVDGTDYVDFVGSWGPLILGHADADVLRAAGEAMAHGTSFGAPTEGEVRLAELLSWVPARRAESVAVYREALDIDPTNVEARLGLAAVLSWQGDRDEANDLFEAVLDERS